MKIRLKETKDKGRPLDTFKAGDIVRCERGMAENLMDQPYIVTSGEDNWHICSLVTGELYCAAEALFLPAEVEVVD